MQSRLLPVCCSFCASIALLSTSTAQQPVAPPPPGKGIQWQVGDTTLKLGGYVKVDLIHDFDAIGSKDSFDPRTIPTDGSEGSGTLMQAKQSRLNLDVRGPTSADPIHFFVEGDFFGTNGAFRLRQAYAEMGPVLGGQTWSAFVDVDAMPETLDFESPIGFPQLRLPQVRYTSQLEDGDSFAVAVEDPNSEVVPPPAPGEAEDVLPSLTARYIWKHARGHVQLGAFGGMSSYRADSGGTDSVPLWGLNLSTQFAVAAEDSAIVQLTYGDGVGQYRGGVTAGPDASGNLEAVPVAGVLGAYEHHWSEKFRSTLMYSWAEGDLPAGMPPANSERLQYLAANLIWQFCDRAWTGVEYLYGTNETFDGNDGAATRLQFAIRFNL
jgi:hypothetical protein